jgi:LPS-assembly protein
MTRRIRRRADLHRRQGLRYQQEQQIATLAGDVVMRQGSMQAEADEANLYQAENRGELKGNVKIRDNGALIVGDHADAARHR